MLGFKVIKHSVLQVTGNLSAALKISVVLWAFSAVVSTIAGKIILEGILNDGAFGAGTRMMFWAIGAFSILIAALIAVSWHRYVLNNERPTSWVPKIPFNLALVYVGKVLLIGLILMLIFVPLVLVFTLLVLGVSGYSDPGAGVVSLLGIAAIALATYIFLRLCVLLPAAALGRKMGVVEAWKATSKMRFDMWVVVALMAILQAISQATALFLYGVPGGNIISMLIGWIIMILGVSIVTTIYGICVENRELA